MSSLPQYDTFEAFVMATYLRNPTKDAATRNLVGVARVMAALHIEDMKSASHARTTGTLEDFTIHDLDPSVSPERVVRDMAEFYRRKGFIIGEVNEPSGIVRMQKDGRMYRALATVADGQLRDSVNLLFTLQEVKG